MSLLYLLSLGTIVMIAFILYRKSKNDTFNQMIVIVTLIISFLGITVLYLYSNKWDSFFIDFSITVISSLLIGVILVSITLGEIQRAEEKNSLKNKQEQRINCLPLIAYVIKDSHNNILNIQIKNIGNQAIRKYNIIINNQNIVPDKIHNCLAVNEERNFSCKINTDNITKESKTITIYVYYQDIAYNKYQQKINVFFILNNTGKMTIDKIIVNDEKLIEDNFEKLT